MMGQVECDTGFGRVYKPGSNRWVIEAWVGQGNANRHVPYEIATMSSTAIAAYKSVCAVAHTQGQVAWLGAMPTAFGTWYAGLNAEDQAGLFECARMAGEFALDP